MPMDEKHLKDILQDIDVAQPDDNARKTAVNLALAAFEAENKKNAEILQGSSLWGRLTGSINPQRTPKMNSKLVYGGMATAMIVVLAATATIPKLQKNIQENSVASKGNGNTFSNIGENIFENSENQVVASAQSVAPGVYDKIARRADEKPASASAPMESPPKAGNTFAKIGQASSAELAYSDVAASEPLPQYSYQDTGRDKFEHFDQNAFHDVIKDPVSTFSIDTDTASYSFVRRQLNSGVLPQKDAVRIEEMVNYFDYDYPLPETREQPFRPSVTVLDDPWAKGRKLVHIGIKGYDAAKAERPVSNLVFLIDTSGSMESPDKLPLAVNALKMMLDQLAPDSTVSIVTYAGSAGIVLEPTKISDKGKILTALDSLGAGGGTAGAEGIRQAYHLARSSFNKTAVNRVILATDGDFNVGITEPEELKSFVEHERESGIYLSVLGFGEGNYNDVMMQDLAQNGNGTAAYIDTLNEARKVLVEEAGASLLPIANDVKIQMEFNPATVSEYRLVGYETRALNREDFNNDKVDAGDIGAGHEVTAIYEITPAGGPKTVDGSRYADAENPAAPSQDKTGEYGFLKIRYKLPGEKESKLITTPVSPADESGKPESMLREANWAVAVAGFGDLLKGGKYTGQLTYDDVIAAAQTAKGDDPFGYRAEFIQLVRLAKTAQALPDTQP